MPPPVNRRPGDHRRNTVGYRRPNRLGWPVSPRGPTLRLVSDVTRTRPVSERVPTLLDEPIKVLRRRDPLRVAPGTSLAGCLEVIQGTGTGDSVVVADVDGRLIGVLTERDIVARLVGTDEGLDRPVETLMNR